MLATELTEVGQLWPRNLGAHKTQHGTEPAWDMSKDAQTMSMQLDAIGPLPSFLGVKRRMYIQLIQKQGRHLDPGSALVYDDVPVLLNLSPMLEFESWPHIS